MNDWKLATYMENLHVNKPGWMGLYSKKTGKTVDPTYRDIGHCMALLSKEALTAAAVVYQDDHEALVALNTVALTLEEIWKRSLQDNLLGLCLFRDLYTRIREIPKGPEAYATFCACFVQSYFSYLFAVQKMAIGLEESFGTSTQEFVGMMEILATLPESLRKAVIKEFAEQGMWPSNISYAQLLRRLDDFIELVKRDQLVRQTREKAKESGNGGHS